ncbi:MAG: type I-E CRISPR-associated protein Cas7/Cse4/CasC [Gemmatimonadota bacterium]
MKTLIEIHALQNFAPSNLNRDDTGAPKDALFGGSRRARVSSQCFKRAVRQHFAEVVARGDLHPDDLGYRTKRLPEALAEALVEKGRAPAEAASKVTAALAGIELTVKDDGKSQYLLFLGRREIAAVAELIHAQWDSIVVDKPATAEGKKATKTKKQAAGGGDPAVVKALEKIFDGGKAVDVALFGRMLADMPEKNQHAACQVAHAISTHAIEREFDFYTAVDDLKPEDTAGADMIGTVEFNSACFYRYAVVDWGKLQENLQGDVALATKGLRAFLEGFVVAEPTGKQNTFAAHNQPEFVVVSVRQNTGARSFANAFETALRPSRTEPLTRISAEALARKASALQLAYGGGGKTFVLNVASASVKGLGTEVVSLKDLLDQTLGALGG